MIYDHVIEGVYIDLKSVLPGDAKVTLEMRQDAEKTRFLHPVENDLEKQIHWIEEQNQREGDYFFLALAKDGKPVGTYGIYDIKGRQGCCGRLLVYGNALQSFEISALAIRFAFEYLGLQTLLTDIDEKNASALKLAGMFGFHFEDAVFDKELDRMVKYGELNKASFYQIIPGIEKRIYRNHGLPFLDWGFSGAGL